MTNTVATDIQPACGESPFEVVHGAAVFRGLPVVRHVLTIAGSRFEITGVKEPADLLDQTDFAQRFLDEDRAPYGLELWPAAGTLAEYVLTAEPEGDLAAIELGCGLGLVSIAAACRGWRVVATDSEPEALRFAAYNARQNGVELAGASLLDWRRPPVAVAFERVLAADVLYQAVDHEPIVDCLRGVLVPSGVALIADPGRGVADRFPAVAQAAGFGVEVLRAPCNGASSESVAGRIFRLVRRFGP